MKAIKTTLLSLALILFSSAAFSQSTSDIGGSIVNAFSGNSLSQAFAGIGGGAGSQLGIPTNPSFTPSYTDLSVNYLGQIFGTVGTVLHGTSGQMLGQLFKVFNIGILVLAGIFLIYTIIMTVLNTAHEGEFMGRKWNSAWIAIRTVFGLGLLVPSSTTGYSAIQVIVMWVVIQGAGFANMAWYSALGYLVQGGQVYTPPATDTSKMVDLVGTVLEMQVCMYDAEKVMKKNQQNLKAAQQSQQASSPNTNTAAPILPQQNFIQNFKPYFAVKIDGGVANSYVRFPGNEYQSDGDQDNACGQISFGTVEVKNADAQADAKASTLKAAIQQIMLDTDSYAKQIVNPSNDQGNSDNFPSQVESAIVGGAADWVNITLPIRAGAPSYTSQMMVDYGQAAVQQGWIMAGRYYFALGNVQRKVTAATSVAVTIDQQPAGFPASPDYISFAKSPGPEVTNMGALRGFSPEVDKPHLASIMGHSGVGIYVSAARAAASQVDQSSKVNLNIGGGGILGFMLEPISSTLHEVLNLLGGSTGDPILILQRIGTLFIALAMIMWLSGTVGLFALGVGSSAMSSMQPLGYGVEDAILAFVPTFTAFILIFYVLGATFAYYVPLIPFIIFVFSAVGWLIAVIEAMVAAPLVALGITHPEGHDLLGKSEQAIMLLLSVFLRPVLMVIGLVAGMILSRVVLRFLNSGFFGIVFDIGDFNLFAFVSILVVYCMLLVAVVNQSFSLIYVIPDRVMRWLGVSEQSTGAQEALQSAKGGFEQMTGGMERLGGGVSSGSAGTAEKAMKRRRDAKSLNDKQTSATGEK
ncbi:MAG: DotA/TraY family protein [Gammaproteobacteria bacterium]|nr:DotA/TraY family protein [Gammaproteobacteria bacterium]